MQLGVTGHRKLNNSDALAPTIDLVLAEARHLAQSRQEELVLISPMAEGADRMVARAALAAGGIGLRVLLPLPAPEYRRGFGSPASRREFDQLLEQAEVVETMGTPEPGASPYLALGQELVRRCDLLLAVWDGLPAQGRGGTAEVVELARRKGRPLFWVHSRQAGKITRERMPGS